MFANRRAFWGTAILGAIAFVAVAFTGWTIRSEAKRKAQFEELDRAFERIDLGIMEYGIDWCGISMPPDSPDSSGTSFYLTELTTPAAYIESFPRDPFSPSRPLGYICPKKASWRMMGMLVSAGPDGDYDLDQAAIHNLLPPPSGYSSLKHYPEGEFWLGHINAILSPATYDPTNGTKSSGDLFRVYDSNMSVHGWGMPNEAFFKARVMSPIKLRAEFAASGIPWTEGDPLPLAKNRMLGEMRDYQMFWPRPMIEAFSTRKSETSRQLLAQAQSRLGHHFAAFIERPAPLLFDETKAYKAWREESPEWWALMDELRTNEYRKENGSEAVLLGTLPLIGKSAAVRAAAEMAEEDWDAAARSLEVLRMAHDLAHLPMQADPWAYRIETELGRIYEELAEQMPRGEMAAD